MIIDIHTHTKPYSDDSDMTPEKLIQKAKRSGLDGICFTEHDFFWEDEDISRLSQKHDFPIFPGVEINIEEGHFIVFGLKKYEFGMHRIKFIKKMVDEVGGAIILAHPYRGRVHQNPDPEQLLERACKNSVCEQVDAVEMLNGRSKAIEIALCKSCAASWTSGLWPAAMPTPRQTYLPARLYSKEESGICRNLSASLRKGVSELLTCVLLEKQIRDSFN